MLRIKLFYLPTLGRQKNWKCFYIYFSACNVKKWDQRCYFISFFVYCVSNLEIFLMHVLVIYNHKRWEHVYPQSYWMVKFSGHLKILCCTMFTSFKSFRCTVSNGNQKSGRLGATYSIPLKNMQIACIFKVI